MKLTFLLSLAAISIAALQTSACSSSSGAPKLGGDGGDDDSTSSSSATTGATSGAGGSGSSTTGTGSSTNTTATSSSTGGGCQPGGQPCQAFSDCCSGTCANQVCTDCGAAGESCAQGCCVGLNCYQNQCASCVVDGASCVNASDCCSNICQQGTCAAPAPCTTCNELILQAMGDPNNLCADSQGPFDALFACACNNGPCGNACAASACQGNLADDACTNCVIGSCSAQLNNCSSH